MNEIKLKVENIDLKSFSAVDVSILFNLIDKNRVQAGKWLIWIDKTNSVEDVEKLIEEFNGRREKGEGLNFGIWNQSNLIGYISFATIDKTQKTAGLAYWLDTVYQGKGIITKSCRVLIEYAFNELGLEKIKISCAEGNKKSRAIPERLGFKEEKIIKESEEIRGGTSVDNHLYVLNKDEWKK